MSNGFYVVAGGYGTEPSGNSSGGGINPYSINPVNGQPIIIPAYVWKTFLILDNQNLQPSDVTTTNAEMLAVLIPNIDIPRSSGATIFPFGASIPGRSITINSLDEWSNWRNWLVTVDEIESLTRLDLFSEIPKNIQDDLEDNVYGFASLLSGESEVFLIQPSSFVSSNNTSIFNNSIANKSSQLVYPFSSTQVSLAQVSPLQVSSTQVSSTQVSSNQVGSTQVGSTQVGLEESRFTQVGITQIGIAEVGSVESALTKLNIAEISSAQIGFIQTGLTKTGTNQIGVTEVGSTQIGIFQINPTQDRSTQINPGQFSTTQTSISQINPTKVSFASSIAAEQFFSVHNNSPTLIYDINNTALTLWNAPFQSSTPPNFSIIIKDLPTGQLAEAQVTQFNAQGTPMGGTLYLDSDGNGLDWYIDPTPWDNSEYSQTPTDTAYRATLGSPAYGHYDLLTTILYETAHLQGFIAGYSGYSYRNAARTTAISKPSTAAKPLLATASAPSSPPTVVISTHPSMPMT